MNVPTKNIRNAVLLGHSGSGKTSLLECMLYEAKAISRIGSVEAGNTISDYTNVEKEKGNSIFTTLTHVMWKDSKINLIDTPGSNDFVGEVVPSLRVADTSIMVLNAQNGVEVGTEILWEHTEKYQTPTLIVINQMDHEKADFDKALDQAMNRFGSKVIPVQYPLNSGPGFNKIIDALRMVMYVFPEGGGKPAKEPIPEAEIQRAQEMHNALVEVAAENDEGLMEKFFDEGNLSEDELAMGLRIALVQHDFFPVFCASSKYNMGTGRVMGFINDIAPSPADRPPVSLADGETLAIDQNGPCVLFIYKTMTEPQVGKVSYFKVYSGSVHSGTELVNPANRTTERINQIFVAEGKIRTQVEELNAGDLGVTVKLKDTHTNDTLCPKGADIRIAPIEFPEPLIRVALVPPGKNEMEKLMKALFILAEEDPTLIIEQNAALKQVLVHGQGQLHLDITKYRIEKVHGISMEFDRPKIMYMETVTAEANGSYRHKKQTGGAGQFAEVHMRIEPYYEGMANPSGLTVRNTEEDELPWGGKLSYYWCIVGGSIDSKFSSAIKKGVMQKMEEGPLTGSRCRDVRVSIYDGKMHPVDSNDMAFMLASSMVFKDIFKQAKPQLLEPIYDVAILCPEEYMGDIMSDLQTRRAMITGIESDGHYQRIMAKVPLAEMYQYASTLKSISQGRAKFTRKFAEYSPLPHDLQNKRISEYQASQEG